MSKFEENLETLRLLGHEDEERNKVLLKKYGFVKACNILLGNDPPEETSKPPPEKVIEKKIPEKTVETPFPENRKIFKNLLKSAKIIEIRKIIILGQNKLQDKYEQSLKKNRLFDLVFFSKGFAKSLSNLIKMLPTEEKSRNKMIRRFKRLLEQDFIPDQLSIRMLVNDVDISEITKHLVESKETNIVLRKKSDIN